MLTHVIKTGHARDDESPGFGAGFFAPETDSAGVFRWMSHEAEVQIAPAAHDRYLELEVLSEFYDLAQTLRLRCGEVDVEHPLPHGWWPVSVTVPKHTATLRLDVTPSLPPAHHANDPRNLTVRVRNPRLHVNVARHARVSASHANTVLNQREMLDGRTQLRSTPPVLGIDLHGECNVKPPCVYCEWDAMKRLEGVAATRSFDPNTLDGYGVLYDNARHLVNCSIGEPFMLRGLGRLLDIFAADGKTLEMSTNGQILSPRQIAELVGRDVQLYVSLDAATPATYARLRNDRFEAILANLRRLVVAKGGRGAPPWLNLVFMPMQANRHELEAFVRLAAELDADQLILRPLNESPDIDLSWERGDYSFDYQQESLAFDELIQLSGAAFELCTLLGVPLANQLDFGGATRAKFETLFDEGRHEAASALAVKECARTLPEATGAPEHDPLEGATDGIPAVLLSTAGDPPPSLGRERWPACTEPWRNLYILRRGVMPCCYGGAPVAGVDSHQEAWNGPLLQEIRRELARGRFADYCLRSPACPLVRKTEHAGELPLAQVLLLQLRRSWQRLNRVTWNLPRRVLAPLRWVLSHAARALRGRAER